MCQDTESVARTGRNNLIVKRDGSQAPMRSHRGHMREGVTERRGAAAPLGPFLLPQRHAFLKFQRNVYLQNPSPPGTGKKGLNT